MATKKKTKKKKSKSASPILECIRDGETMKPYTNKEFKGYKCPSCGYFEGKIDPAPKKKKGAAFVECPECGNVKALEIDEPNRIGIVCCSCGYTAGRPLKRVENEQLIKLDEEIASIEQQIDPSLLKSN